MKLTKTIKYKLTEETLEKDINSFISEARKGRFNQDYKYGNEGLKIIKQYFKILKEKFDKEEYEECAKCYHKLILFLFDASRGDDEATFDYEDLLARISNDFDKFIKNYFISLIKTWNIEELAGIVSEYASKLKDYGFESDKKILLKSLKKEELMKLEELMLKRTENTAKKDEQEILYFLLVLARIQKDKNKYLGLCERFKGILNNKELEFLKGEYEENE